ncbi:GntR family transcriptional regulator [Longispora urticae]
MKKSHTRRKKQTQEKGTKDNELRPVTLGPETLLLLELYRTHCDDRAAALGLELAEDAFTFSLEPDHSEPMIPGTVGQRFARLTSRLGFPMGIHSLRHFSATELVAAGVDIRTVAGRLGHGSGGAITLKFYSACVSERDQQAAGNLERWMPALPFRFDSAWAAAVVPETEEPNSPYQKIAADLRGANKCGALAPGSPVPTVQQLQARYKVSFCTAHRAIALLAEEGMIITQERGTGRRP